MTSYALTAFATSVQTMIQGSDADYDLSAADLQAIVRAALAKYSQDLPDVITEDETATGSAYFSLAGLASWSEGFSRIVNIEYPAAVIASNTEPTYLDPGQYDETYQVGTLKYVRFIGVTPTSGQTIRFHYTAPYAFAGSPSAVDIPTEHYYPLCHLAACYACRSISAKYSRINDSPLGVDSAANTTKAQEFANRAGEYCKLYSSELNQMDIAGDGGGAGNLPASAFADWDTQTACGRGSLFHRCR
jgi:hypothetical protein